MPHKQTADLNIYVEEKGEGAPVLFISGTAADLRIKPNFLDGPLARSHHVIGYDQRGLGQTQKPDGPYTMTQYGDDAAALLDVLGYEQVDVVGVSFGGMVAQHLALDHPTRVRKLVLCCTSPGGEMPSYPFHELPDGMDPVDRMMQLMSVSDTRRDAAWQAANPEVVAKLVDVTRSMAIKEHAMPAFIQGARWQLEARARHSTLDRLHDLEQPTMICAGSYDGIAPPDNQDKLHACIKGSTLHWFEGGHLFLIQDKQAWQEILTFLADASLCD